MPLKIYADLGCNMKGVSCSDRNNNTSYTEKYQKRIPCSFVYKVVCIDDEFRKPVVLYSRKMQFID